MIASGPNPIAKVRRPWTPRYLPDDGTYPVQSFSELLAKIDLGGRNLAGATDADTLSGVDALPAPVGSSCVAITPGYSSSLLAAATDLLGSLRAFLRSKSVPAGSPAPVTELLGSLTHPASDN